MNIYTKIKHAIAFVCFAGICVYSMRYFALSQNDDYGNNGYGNNDYGNNGYNADNEQSYSDDNADLYENNSSSNNEYGENIYEDEDYSDGGNESEDNSSENIVEKDDAQPDEMSSLRNLTRELNMDGDAEWENMSVEYSYAFSMLNRDDPFVPKISLAQIFEEDSLIEDVGVVEFDQKEGVLSVSLDSMTLSGIWTSGGIKKALVLGGKKGGAVIVGIGDKIGDKNGTIVDILEDTLVVRQEWINNDQKRIVEDEMLTFQSAKDAPSDNKQSGS